MLPKSWDDVFYLTRKEVLADESLPDFSIDQLKQIHKLFWGHIKELMRDESEEITIHKVLRLVPKKDANGNHEKRDEIFYKKPTGGESGR